MALLEIKNLSLKRNHQPILHPLSFSLGKGEIVCLAGRNGAGKTSLFRCLIGQMSTYTGRVEFEGEELGTGALAKIGVLIDGPSLYAHLSGRENLDIIRRYYRLSAMVVDETLELVGLLEAGDKLVKHYSSGMKQRLGIGIAFVHRPKLLLLDEPLNTLDPEAIVEVRKLIAKLNQTFQTSFLISSHALEEIGKVYHRLMILKRGALVFDGRRESVNHYCLLRGEAPNGMIQLPSVAKQSALFVKLEDGQVEAVGNLAQLEELRRADTGIAWAEQPSRASIEELYLLANFAT